MAMRDGEERNGFCCILHMQSKIHVRAVHRVVYEVSNWYDNPQHVIILILL
jgi:hypothetical protein